MLDIKVTHLRMKKETGMLSAYLLIQSGYVFPRSVTGKIEVEVEYCGPRGQFREKRECEYTITRERDGKFALVLRNLGNEEFAFESDGISVPGYNRIVDPPETLAEMAAMHFIQNLPDLRDHAILDWAREFNPKVLPQLQQILASPKTSKIQALRLMLMFGFEAGRMFQNKNSDLPLGRDDAYIPFKED